MPAATDPAARVAVVSGDRVVVEAPATDRLAPVDASLVTLDGRVRTYHVYVPSMIDPDPDAERVPLLLALHGGGGGGDQYERSAGFAELAETNGFIVVYPDGVGIGSDGSTLRTWNGGYCCGPAAREDVDDVAFVRLVLDKLQASYPIDGHRVYVAGHSNGAMLAYRLACELSDRIAAIGVQSGALVAPSCNPAQPVSVLHIHGTADSNVPIGGGFGSESVSRFDYPVPEDGTRTLARADRCSARPTTERPDRLADVTVSRWTGCREGTVVAFLAVDGADHSWMGHPGDSPKAETAYDGLDSSATIWNFLIQHPRG